MKVSARIQLLFGTAHCFFTFWLVALLATGCATRSEKTANLPNSSADPAHQLQAGMAEIDITPPIGFRMAGYFNERCATGIHDPLKAKALVLREGNMEVAMVFCDLLGHSLTVTREARAEASRLTGIPVANIVMAATHTHTGPLFDDVRDDYFHKAALEKNGSDPHKTIDYPRFLTKQLVTAIVEAKTKLQPAELEAGIAQHPGLAFNRRYHMKDGRTVFNPGILNTNVIGPAGPTDPDVDMLLVKGRRDGRALGGLTVFAMHCDSIGGTLYSADYPYFIQEKLRCALGSDYISAFGAGTCGDINHVNPNKRQNYSGFDVAARNGDAIGETVVENLSNLKSLPHPALGVRGKTLMLPLQTYTPEQLAAAKTNLPRLDDPKCDFTTRVETVKVLDLVRRDKTVWPMEVQVFRLDADTAIVCLPAEIFCDFGLSIKKASPFKNTFVVSICNDRPGYMPTLKAFKEGSYEIINSRLKPGSGEAMTDTAIQLLKELKQ